jgi:hypothetical protein
MFWQDEKKLNTARKTRELILSLSLSLSLSLTHTLYIYMHTYIYYKTEQNMENTPGTQ